MMVLPASGWGSPARLPSHYGTGATRQFLVLPVTTLAMIPIGIIARTTRAAVAEVRSQISSLRCAPWGWARRGDPACAQERLATGAGGDGAAIRLSDGGLHSSGDGVHLAGSGFLLFKAIINRDIPVLQGTILALSLIFVATNLIVDLLQAVLTRGSAEHE